MPRLDHPAQRVIKSITERSQRQASRREFSRILDLGPQRGITHGFGGYGGINFAKPAQQVHPATAQARGRHVKVASVQVPKPAAVRYGWANNPIVNLYDRADLPLTPFRTDDWDGVTKGILK